MARVVDPENSTFVPSIIRSAFFAHEIHPSELKIKVGLCCGILIYLKVCTLVDLMMILDEALLEHVSHCFFIILGCFHILELQWMIFVVIEGNQDKMMSLA